MKLSPHVISKIQIALTDKGMNQSELAQKVGLHRSHISKILKGQVEDLKDQHVDSFNDALGIDLNPINFQQVQISPAAMELSLAAEKDAVLRTLLESLAHVVRPKMGALLPQVDTKRLPKIGAEITRIVAEWENAKDPHYAKIAVEVLDMLRKFYAKNGNALAK